MTDTTFVDQQTVIQASWCNDVNSHVYKDTPVLPATTLHAAAHISNVPSGSIASTTVQNALNEITTDLLNSADLTQGSALVGNSIQRISNIAALRTIAVSTSRDVETQGYYTAGDRGNGIYYGVTGASPGTYVDNGGTIIVPTGGNGSSAWLLRYTNFLNVKQFGAKGDGTTDDTATIQACVNVVKVLGGQVFFPDGKYLLLGAAGADSYKNGILINWSTNFYGSTLGVDLIGESSGGVHLLAGASSMTLVRVSRPHVSIRNIQFVGGISGGGPYTPYPGAYPNNTNVIGYLVGPENITDTVTKISTNHFSIEDCTISWCTYGEWNQVGPAGSGGYLHTRNRIHSTDNITHLNYPLSADFASVKNVATVQRVNNCYFAGGNCLINARGVSGVTFENCYGENINAGSSPLATPTAIYVPTWESGLTYGHAISLIDTQIELTPAGAERWLDNSDSTTVIINSGSNFARAVGENLATAFNKFGPEVSGNTYVANRNRITATANGSSAEEGSINAGGLYTKFIAGDIDLGFATGGNTFSKTASTLGRVSFNSAGVLQVDADPNNIAANSAFIANVDGTQHIYATGGVVGIGTTTLPGAGTLTTGVGFTTGGSLSAFRSANTSTFLGRSNDGEIVALYSGTAQHGTISISGSTTTYGSVSDYRLKENLAPLTGAIDRVMLLKPYRGNFLSSPDKTLDMFVAHEFQEVVPEGVTGTKDEVDTEGNPIYQAIDPAKAVPLLVAALQEIINEVNSLKAQLNP